MANELIPRRSLRKEAWGFLTPGRLRFKAMVAVVLVVFSPLFWVWSSQMWDGVSQMQLAHGLTSSTQVIARSLAKNELDTELVARSQSVRIRLLDDQGVLLDDADHEGAPRWHHRISNIFFGPEGRPDPSQFDATRVPVHQRPEWQLARTSGTGTACASNPPHTLLTCAEVRSVQVGSETRWLHVQASRARAARALYADRFQMLQLSLTTLLFALLLTVWLSTRWVRPLESLRDQALERTRGSSTEPLLVERADELGELATAFNTLLSAIESRNRANETFAADLAHELKNPLAAVRTAAEALAPGRPLTEQRAARLQRILDDSSRRMMVVIERFLELARAEAGLHELQRQPIDLFALCSALLAPLRADDRFSGVTFTLTGKAVMVNASAERMETALRNLIENAASFATPDGTVTVHVDSSPSPSVQVSDTGPGIAEEDLERVFDRYFTKRQGGTGLGLALSRAIAEAHGGTLVAASPPESGAVFTLQLP